MVNSKFPEFIMPYERSQADPYAEKPDVFSFWSDIDDEEDEEDEELYSVEDEEDDEGLCFIGYDEDEEDEEGDEEQVTSITVSPSELGNKKIAALDMLAYDLTRVGQLKTTAGGQIYAYDSEHGYYRRPESPEQLVERLLSVGGHFARMSVRDVKDLCTKISWFHSIRHPADDFNSNEQEINTVDGILNFKTGIVTEHTPERLFTYAVDAKYLSTEQRQCSTFDQFCRTSLPPLYSQGIEADQKVIETKRRLLLEIIGYACCDSNAGKCALFLKGEPDTGKSVIANFITRLFPPELVSNIPLHKLSDRFNKAALFGKKLNVAGEIQGKRLSEISTFKSITGGDTISAEFKGKDIFSFAPRCKLLFAGNALPGTLEADATKAFVNRLVVLLFNHSIPKEKQDKELLDKLWAERDSIFSWSMDALRGLRARNYQFTLPEESKLFLEGFASRRTSMQAFLKDCCHLSPDARIFNTELFSAYEDYCARNGLEKLGRQKFYEMLSGVPGISMKRLRIGAENRWGHTGVCLRREAAK